MTITIIARFDADIDLPEQISEDWLENQLPALVRQSLGFTAADPVEILSVESSDSVAAKPLNIHRLVAEWHAIANIWHIEDVLEVRPDLTREQAWQVLQSAQRCHDANIGHNWESLDAVAQSLFGDPTGELSHA